MAKYQRKQQKPEVVCERQLPPWYECTACEAPICKHLVANLIEIDGRVRGVYCRAHTREWFEKICAEQRAILATYDAADEAQSLQTSTD